LASAAAAAASLAFAASASAATIQVDSTGDELVATPFPVAGSCTLREALKSAEDNNAFGGCTPGAPGNDIITFSPTVFPNPTTINLTIGQLVVNTDVTITGPGHGELIVKAAPTARVLWIVGGTVTLSGLNIEGGDLSSDPLTYHAEGGGILSSGDLTLDDVVVKSNQLTATSVAGFDAVAGGGGIYQQGSGSLTLDHSTVSGNTATAHNPQADDLDSYVQGAGIITFPTVRTPRTPAAPS
jgi:CSLREA domain-containing protein